MARNTKIRSARRMFGEELSPEQLHRAFALRKPCHICGGPPAIRIRVLAPVTELMAKSPDVMLAIAANNPEHPGGIPTIPTKYGPMVMVSDLTACDRCKVEAERASAKHPSWVIVEIDHGAGPDKLVTSGSAP